MHNLQNTRDIKDTVIIITIISISSSIFLWPGLEIGFFFVLKDCLKVMEHLLVLLPCIVSAIIIGTPYSEFWNELKMNNMQWVIFWY